MHLSFVRSGEEVGQILGWWRTPLDARERRVRPDSREFIVELLELIALGHLAGLLAGEVPSLPGWLILTPEVRVGEHGLLHGPPLNYAVMDVGERLDLARCRGPELFRAKPEAVRRGGVGPLLEPALVYCVSA